MKKIAILLFFFSKFVFAQADYPIDTTYTIKSVYDKVKKESPNVSLVQPRKYDYVKQKKEIVYKTTNNRKLHLDAYCNTTNKRNPAVVILHGGGWKSGNKSQMETFAIELASKGYSCFTIEFRLSPEALYPAAIFDVKKSIQYLRKNAKKFNIDTTKIAILGCSSGGQMASLIGTTNGNRNFEDNNKSSKSSSNVQAIINIDGILAFKHPESEEGKVAGLWLGGSYEEKGTVWQQASSLNHTDKNTPPTLFINSSIPRFHAGRNDMIEIMNKYGIYKEVRTIQKSPHSFWFLNPWFDETINYTATFLDKVFKQ